MGEEDYIGDKKKEFKKLQTAKQQQDQFAAEIFQQKSQTVTDDEDPGDSDIPKPGSNVAQIIGQSSSERLLSRTKPSGKYESPKISPKRLENMKNHKEKKEKPPDLNKSESHGHPSSHRRKRSNST